MPGDAGAATMSARTRRPASQRGSTTTRPVFEGGSMFNDNGSFLLAMFEFFIFFAWFMCLWWIFGDVFRSRDIGGVAKTLWVLFIIILPILGMLVYLLARGRGMTERTVAEQQVLRSQQDEYIKSVAGSGATAADQIASAKALLDSGAVTQAEYESLKAKALA
jgi:hypothetical protein